MRKVLACLVFVVSAMGCEPPMDPYGRYYYPDGGDEDGAAADLTPTPEDLYVAPIDCGDAGAQADMAVPTFFQVWPAWGVCRSASVTGNAAHGTAAVRSGKAGIFAEPRAVLYFKGEYDGPPSVSISCTGPNGEPIDVVITGLSKDAVFFAPRILPQASTVYTFLWDVTAPEIKG